MEYQITFKPPKEINHNTLFIDGSIKRKCIEIAEEKMNEFSHIPVMRQYSITNQLKKELADLIAERELILKYGNL